MKNQVIVIQGHIPYLDVQGNLSYDEKLDMFETSLIHLRKNNPKTPIILCGHGESEPTKKTRKQCDEVVWTTPCLPLDKRGCVEGQPAQYKVVYQGIKKARELGFSEVLKTRADCIIGMPNICGVCKKILDEECKDILLTQQTATKRFKMGDCFMFSDIHTMSDIWNEDNPVQCEVDGVINTGMNWIKHHLLLKPNEVSEYEWEQLLKYYCSFRDVSTLRFVDLRWNWTELKHKKYEIFNNTLDHTKYIWGVRNGWHSFDKDGNDLIRFDGTAYTRKTFYENNK